MQLGLDAVDAMERGIDGDDFATAAAAMHDVSHLHLLSPRAGGRLDKVILSRVLPETRGNSVLCQRRPGLNC